MAYVQPDGEVQFFREIGISPNYENCLYFSTTANKDIYFNNLTKITKAEALTYSRHERGYIRVEVPISTMLTVGYMRFRNSHFSNKWFYAFVKSVEYINNTTTQVNFELDVMMTWMGAFTLKQCYVERQHSLTDAIGGNIVDENLDIGEYLYYNSVKSGYLDKPSDYYTCIWSATNSTGDDFPQTYNFYEGIYSAANLYYFPHTFQGLDDLNDFFDKINQNKFQDSIVCVCECPKAIIDDYINYQSGDHHKIAVQPISKPPANMWGITIHNNKMFTYPYTLLRCTNCEGDNQDYRFEFFSTNTANFSIMYNIIPPMQLVLYPKNYKGLTDNVQEVLNLSNLPMGAFPNDTYKAFLSQTKSAALMNIANIPGNIGGSVLTGAMLGGGAGALIGAAGGAITTGVKSAQMAAQPQLEKITNKMIGRSQRSGHGCSQQGNATVNAFYTAAEKDFYFNTLQITPQYAKCIDDYFTMFGYAQKKIMYPNMDARPHWTYVKTIGCTIDGNLPADDASVIENIFDNGVRFWKDHTKIGRYDIYNNSPT